jgi:hypothetical protein
LSKPELETPTPSVWPARGRTAKSVAIIGAIGTALARIITAAITAYNSQPPPPQDYTLEVLNALREA